jgi:hypothetical protein
MDDPAVGLPPGFALDQAPDTAATLPPGFALDQPSLGQCLLDLVKSAGVGVAKGGVSLAGLPGDVAFFPKAGATNRVGDCPRLATFKRRSKAIPANSISQRRRLGKWRKLPASFSRQSSAVRKPLRQNLERVLRYQHSQAKQRGKRLKGRRQSPICVPPARPESFSAAAADLECCTRERLAGSSGDRSEWPFRH